jgi:hypothetical protein
MQTLEMDLARLVSSGLLSLDAACEISAYPKEIMAHTSTLRAQAQAEATLAAGQVASTGSAQFVGPQG